MSYAKGGGHYLPLSRPLVTLMDCVAGSQYEGGSGYYDPFGKVCVKSGSQYANYCLPGSSSNFIVQGRLRN